MKLSDTKMLLILLLTFAITVVYGFTCNGIDSSSETACSGHGTCIGTNICNCVEGYGGTDCQYIKCFGILSNETNVCSGRGFCISPDNCACVDYNTKVAKNTLLQSTNEVYREMPENDYLVSSDGTFKLVIENKSLRLYNGPNLIKILYNPDRPLEDYGRMWLIMLNYALALFANSGGTVWTQYVISIGFAPYSLVLQNDGNLVVYYQSGIAWTSETAIPGRSNDYLYTGSYCQEPRCFGYNSTDINNVCSGKGTCIDANTCNCETGWKGSSDCSVYSCDNLNNCNGNGVCIGNNTCQCQSGWKGSKDCSVFTCDNLNNCNNKGICVGNNTCSCVSGWKGSNDCNTYSCEALNNCNEHGICVNNNTCQCQSGWKGSNDCSVYSCDGLNNCNGKGICTGNNTCSCQSGWKGSKDCSVYSCEDLNNCNGHGICSGNNTCKCDSGWKGSNDCSIFSCDGLSNCNGRGDCISNNTCNCTENYGGSMCEYHKCFGKLSTDKSVCSGHGFCIGVDNCACVDYRTTAKNTLASSSTLFLNEYIMSSNGRFKLILESGGLRIYDNSTVKRVITTFNPTYTTIKLQMQGNGNLVLSISGTTLWETMTANGGIPPYNLVMQSDGNLILYHAGGYLTNWNTAVAGLTSDYFYGGNNCQEPRCFGLSPSHSNVCSGKGTCTDLNTCNCQSGWKGSKDCSVFTCDNLNNCNNKGICVGNNTCSCISGWKGSNDCNTYSCETLNNCSEHGICTGNNTCQCNSGWKGSNDCKVFTCDGLNNCNGKGECTSNNTCNCQPGWRGSSDCSIQSCELLSDCSGHGICTSPNTCSCNAGYLTYSNCSVVSCELLNSCSNHGYCIDANICNCDSGWKGSNNCSQFSCDNLNNCNNHGTCVNNNTCQCQSGWKGSKDCSVYSCDAFNNCNNKGICVGNNTCSCDSGWKGSNDCNTHSCEALNYCSSHGVCANNNTCQCQSGWKGSNDCSKFTCESINNCNNHGICSGPNSCECQSGWKGATDCSKQSCEILDNCSSHGICVDPNRCDCQSGWKVSNNCSMFTCDGLNNCNNRGSCIGPNQCLCLENNYGSQCDVEITLQYPSIVSLSTNITFTPNITSILSNPLMTFKWSQINGPNTLDLDNISTTGTDKKDLTIKANTDTFNNGLIEGATYHLKLHITVKELNGSYNVEKVVMFTPNRSPIINSFSVVDSLTNQETAFGLVDQTNFKLTILNASDPENQDLQYSFGYFNQLGEKIIISPFSSNNYTFFKVPILGTVRLFFAVRDSMLSVTQKEFGIMLIDPIDSSNEKQLIDYVSSLVNSTSVDYNNLQVLEVATVLLDKTLNSNTSREAERIELKSKIINNLSNYIINNNQSDVSSVVNILNLLSNQTKEITVPTSIKSLTILKTLINNNHNRNEISEKREDILKITSQLITSTFSSQQQTNTSDIVKNILDGISKFTAINLNNGEFIISNYNNINSLFIKGRIEEIVNILTTSLNSSLTSIIGLTSINIPIDSIQQIIGLNTVVLSIQKVNPIIYSFSERILTSSILRISLFSQNGNVIEINQLTKPIEFELKMTTTTVPTGMIRKCLYFNEKLKQFSDEGVETVNVTGEEKLKCKVYHLTDFTTGMQVLQPRSSISKVMISTGSVNSVNNLWLYLVLMISFYIAIK